jgi:hypothetical protein
MIVNVRPLEFRVTGVTMFLPAMDVLKMIAALRAERVAIDEALIVLERLAGSHGKRRGRPPAWMTAIRGGSTTVSKRTRVMSAETRKKMADAQKKRWAAYRKAAAS